MLIWATKQIENLSDDSDGDSKIHLIVESVGPFSRSACGIVAQADYYYGWYNFRQYKNIMKESGVCGKCLAFSKEGYKKKLHN